MGQFFKFKCHSCKNYPKKYCGQCCLLKFVWCLPPNTTGALCVWAKVLRNDLKKQQYPPDITPLSKMLFWFLIFLCPWSLAVPTSRFSLWIQKAISEFQNLSLSKRGYVRNLCCENEFYLHENNKSFSCQWFRIKPRFETEAWDNLEMVY